MKSKKLNNIVSLYRASKVDFSEVYAATKKIRDMNQSIIVGQFYGDVVDALQIFDDVLLELIESDMHDFEHALNASLRKRRINLLRDNRRRRTRQRSFEEVTEQNDDEGAATPDILRCDYDLEHEVFRKKEADHLQVIDSLIRDCNPDATTTAIVEAYLSAPLSATRNEIAKSLGLNHEVVRRKLRRLARHYDANRFGDYREYLAV